MQSKPSKSSIFELLKEGTSFNSKAVAAKGNKTAKAGKATEQQAEKAKKDSVKPDSESEIEEEGFFRARNKEEQGEMKDEHENSKAENRRYDRVA